MRDAMKSPKTLPKRGAICQQWVRCGRPGCRCSRGDLHGPYAYLFSREGGKLRKRYIRLDAAPSVQAACIDRREEERRAREALQAWWEKWRLLRRNLREVSSDD